MSLELPLIGHLRELRKYALISTICILISFIPSYYFYEQLLPLVLIPFQHLASPEYGLIITSLFEGFTMKMKISFLAALIITTPIHLFFILRFIFPGLKTRERRWFSLALTSGFVLAFLSLYIGYFHLLPFSIHFLTTQQFIPQDTGVLLHFGDNILSILKFLFLGALAFQFPIFLQLMMAFGLVTRKQVIGGSRYAIIAIFILSAIVTPPDVVSQLCFSLPLLILFGLTLLTAKLFKFGEEVVC